MPAARARRAQSAHGVYLVLVGDVPAVDPREAGIFHGLDVEVIATPTGVEDMNALIAGEVQFLQISGGTTASALGVTRDSMHSRE